MSLIFVTRRYPPSVGGIQTFSFHLHRSFAANNRVTLVALGKDNPLHLLWFVPVATLRIIIGLMRGAELVYFSDGVIAALAPLLRRFGKARFAVTVQGLEVTYPNQIVGRIIRRGVMACDDIFAGSENTRALMAQAGIPPERVTAMYCGVEPTPLDPAAEAQLRTAFVNRTGIRLGEEPVLLNVGRQVARKGLGEFLTEVLPRLDPVPAVVLCGTGPEHERLVALAAASPYANRIHLLGLTDDDTTTMLRRSCSLFLMPNIHVPGDAEGFGIAPLEAMYEGLPVVGYAVDALPESLREGSWLLRPGDSEGFARCITAALAASDVEREAKRDEARDYVRRENSWAGVAERYLAAIRSNAASDPTA